MSSLLITGAGFVGSWVARELLDLGHKATLFDVAPQMDALRHWVDPEGVPIIRGDLQNIPEILDAIEKSEAEAVLHLASFLTAGVRERPYAGVQVNLMGTVNVLDAPASRGCVAWCSVARQACMAGFRGQYRQGKRRISCSGPLASGPAISMPFASLPRSTSASLTAISTGSILLRFGLAVSTERGKAR